LEELLSQPSAESWHLIVEMGKRVLKTAATEEAKLAFARAVAAVERWPPEIERLCPASWPADFRAAVEHRVRETDTYEHYIAKICGHPDLRLSDGSQAVWLERRYTGGIVEVSTVKSALRLLAAAQSASSVKTANDRVRDAVRMLAGGTRNVGKVGCADLTGGVVVEGRYVRFPHTASVKELGCGSWTLQDAGAIKRNEHRLEVEVKVGDEPQRPEQVARMESVRRRGGCYVLCNSVESAVAQIKAFISSH
jgi:hypothetical protein